MNTGVRLYYTRTSGRQGPKDSVAINNRKISNSCFIFLVHYCEQDLSPPISPQISHQTPCKPHPLPHQAHHIPTSKRNPSVSSPTLPFFCQSAGEKFPDTTVHDAPMTLLRCAFLQNARHLPRHHPRQLPHTRQLRHTSTKPKDDPIDIPTSLWHQRLGPVTSFFSWFHRTQQKRPLTVQVCTSLTVYLCGDLLAQEIGGEKYDSTRTLRMLTIGAVASIPGYKWYGSP